MRYDFDMFYVDNAQVSRGVVSSGLRTNLGALRTNHIMAVFRDSATIDAVMQAPPIVRLFLEEAGFATKTARNTVVNPDDHSEEPRMRALLVEQISTALANRAMKKALGRAAHESAFNIHEFIAFVVAKDPYDNDYDEVEMPEITSDIRVKPRRPKIAPKATRRRTRPN